MTALKNGRIEMSEMQALIKQLREVGISRAQAELITIEGYPAVTMDIFPTIVDILGLEMLHK